MLTMWTVYDHPRDQPDAIVARRFEVTSSGATPTSELLRFGTLRAVREYFSTRGLFCLTREPDDDPNIVETWM